MYFKFASCSQEDISVGQEMGNKGSRSYMTGFVVKRFNCLNMGCLMGC